MIDEVVLETLKSLTLTADLVASYVAYNHVPSPDLPSLITTVHGAVSGLVTVASPHPAKATQKPLSPAQVRESITPSALISFLDGRPYKTLKRHLTKYDLDPASYRERFGLPADYPMVAASYSERRAGIAKSVGLGRRSGPPQPASAEPAPRKRKRA